jgi:hypothetical protein
MDFPQQCWPRSADVDKLQAEARGSYCHLELARAKRRICIVRR